MRGIEPLSEKSRVVAHYRYSVLWKFGNGLKHTNNAAAYRDPRFNRAPSRVVRDLSSVSGVSP